MARIGLDDVDRTGLEEGLEAPPAVGKRRPTFSGMVAANVLTAAGERLTVPLRLLGFKPNRRLDAGLIS